jgi:parallel beta-helix repeat protein
LWNRVFSVVIFVLLLANVLPLAFNIQPVMASGAIYIRADGSIDSPTAPISTLDNVTYTLTGNITNSDGGIAVERNNIIIDGAGYTIQGSIDRSSISTESKGIDLTGRNNVTIQNMEIKTFNEGVFVARALASSSNNTIFRNDMNNNNYGICLLEDTPNNSMDGNIITNNKHGIYLQWSSNGTVSGNIITNNEDGIYLMWSNNNEISGNRVTNNEFGIVLDQSHDDNVSGNNVTDNVSGGIWIYHSSNNTISGNDVIANSEGMTLIFEYNPNNVIYHNNFINNTQHVQILTLGYANSWDDGYPSGGNYWSDYTGVDANGDGIGDTPYVIDANNTDNYPLMSNYVIPEFSSFLILPLLFIATLFAVIAYKKRRFDSLRI